MLTEVGLQRTESTVLQYSMKHEPYEARIVLGRVYEGEFRMKGARDGSKSSLLDPLLGVWQSA